jgi:hypothetical protein
MEKKVGTMSEEGRDVHEGGCLCGAVRFAARGEPFSTNACYCTQCRRQTGSALPSFASWKPDRFALTKGATSFHMASEKAERHFCPSCGSPIFWRKRATGDVDVFVGVLDRPEAVRPPDIQLWTRHRLPWVPPLPGVRDHAQGMQDEE